MNNCGTWVECGDIWVNQAIIGAYGTGPDKFNGIGSVAVSADGLTAWIVDSGNNRISVWTRPDASSTAWSPEATFGSYGTGSEQFDNPRGIALSADRLTVWVADAFNVRISVWTLTCPA